MFIKNSKMLVTGQKRKHGHKTQPKKAQTLKGIEKELSNKEVPENTMYQKIPYLHGSKIKTKSCRH